jgi:6-phosphogluconate dehydrogenase
MGQNLALNIADHNYAVAVYNRTTSVVDDFLDGPAAGASVVGAHSLEELVAALKPPARVLLMVKAGPPVDHLVDGLLPLLPPGAILVDGGNSHFEDTRRRVTYVESRGLLFVGAGISGGAEGARHGPSMMPGGSPAAWPHLRPILQAVAAKVPEGDPDGVPCCDWVGPDGAGHFVKMVHNGIEYADMQIIAEAYHVMRDGLGLANDAVSAVFARWNRGPLESYLVEITRDILAHRDAEGRAVVDLILDSAGQKGTGRWTVAAALDGGVPLPLVGEAVFARSLSALVDERAAAARTLAGPERAFRGDPAALLADLEGAVYAAKIISYAQGFALLRATSRTYGWGLDLGAVAALWRGGCIIRAALLETIREAYAAEPDLPNLLLAPAFRDALASADGAWRRAVAAAVELAIPIPALSAALAFRDAYRCDRLPANLIQAQRDYFGAHTYERIDRPRGEFYHTDWTGRGPDRP